MKHTDEENLNSTESVVKELSTSSIDRESV